MQLLKKILSSVHFLVLLGLLLFACLPLTFSTSLPIEFWFKQSCMFIFWVSTFYLTLLILIPNLLYRRRAVLFAFIIFFILCFSFFLNHQLDSLINLPLLIEKYSPTHERNRSYNPVGDLSIVLITMVIVGIAIIIAVTKKVQNDQLKDKALENQKISTELSFLKSQINPHFFFNVLHTIYGLTERAPEKAKDSIYTLSHMMRYVLYETKNDNTTLEKELLFIDNYNKLMQLRLPENTQIIFDKPSAGTDIEIAPMLFLPFIENAYKHGISTIYPSYIYIGISLMGNSLLLEVRNSNFNEKANDMEESNGIGLNNTRRRLNLLYPDRHSLKITDNKNLKEFTIQLKLFLS